MSTERVAHMQAEVRRLMRQSHRFAVWFVAALGMTQVLGWETSREIWAIALLNLGNSALAVSDLHLTRPRLANALVRLSLGAAALLALVVVLDLVRAVGDLTSRWW